MSELKISPELLQISPEVQDALKNKKPVVALESTIISHGIPSTQHEASPAIMASPAPVTLITLVLIGADQPFSPLISL